MEKKHVVVLKSSFVGAKSLAKLPGLWPLFLLEESDQMLTHWVFPWA